MYIIYHGNCYDGWAAAWVAKKAHPEAILLPMLYGDEPPMVPEGATVYFIDISMPREKMEAFAATHETRVLDHHKTAQAALEGLPYAVFDMNKSGAMLAWEEFFPDQESPLLIKYIQDQDLWAWKLPLSREVCAFIRSYPRDIDSYDYLADYIGGEYDESFEHGKTIMRADNQRIEDMCQQAVMATVGGYDVPMVNATVLFSAVANKMLDIAPQAPFAGYFMFRGDGKIQVGLRGRGDFDVSAVAKEYGGGGHFSASGFEIRGLWEIGL